MIVAHGAPLVTFLDESSQHVHIAARVRLVIVPLVRACPALRQMRRGGKCPVEHGNIGLLNVRVAFEIAPHKLAVPGPAVFGIRRRMHADIPAAFPDVPLESRLLLVVQHIACRVQEHHRAVSGQIRPHERRTVFRVRDREPMLLADFPKGLHAVFNGTVTEPRRFAENEDGQIGIVLRVASVLRSSRFFDKGLPCQKKTCKEKEYGQAARLP